MRSSTCSPSILRRSAVVAAVAALGVAVLAPAASARSMDDSIAKKKPTINTYKGWSGNQSVVPFGCPDSTTYGQTVTVPNSKHEIKKFTFHMNDGGATGSMKARGEIYAWDGSKATGSAVGETQAKTIDLPDALYHPVSFMFKNAHVTPGAQYVIFASIDKDYEACTNYGVSWGATDDGAYTGGTFDFQNNADNESNWTTAPWNPAGIDAVLKAFMG